MRAIKLAAVGLLMIGGTAVSRPWQDKRGEATTQPDPPAGEQEQAPPDEAQADRGDAAGDRSTREAETDSADSDRPAWLVGRWCVQGSYWVTIIDGQELMLPDGTRHGYNLRANRAYVTVAFLRPLRSGGFTYEGMAIYDPERGEPSMRPGPGEWPLVRC